MTAFATVLVIVLLLLVGAGLGVLWCRSRHTEPDYSLALHNHRRAMLSAARAGAKVRFEVQVDDWEEAAPEPAMRWRWTVWDADRALTGANDDLRIGVDIPFMLGNAATKGLAIRDATVWVLENIRGGTGGWVIRP